MEKGLKNPVVQKQLELLKLCFAHPAFASDAKVTISGEKDQFSIKWEKKEHHICLNCDLKNLSYEIAK